MRRIVILVISSLLCLGWGIGTSAAVGARAHTDPGTGSVVSAVPAAVPGSFVSLNPARVLDTRGGFGAAGPVPANGSISVQITGAAGVPATGASAVVLNVTVTSPVGNGFITVYPEGTSTPNASNLNFLTGQTIPNLVVVPLGTNGKIRLANGSPGTTQLIADVAGYYLSDTPMTFSAATVIDPPHGGPVSVSCPTATFCAAVDTQGAALTFNGTTWTPPITITDSADYGWTSVSCPSASFCVAVGDGGQVSTFNGATWTSPVTLPSGWALMSVSCATSMFCVAMGSNGRAFTFNGTTWSTGYQGPLGSFASVSCPTTNVCQVVGYWGAASFNGSAWGPFIELAPWFLFNAVSCSSATFCMAGAGSSYTYMYNGATWAPVALPVPDAHLNMISCRSSTYCVGTESSGGVNPQRSFIFNGTSWSGPTTIGSSQTRVEDISCPTTTY